LHRLICDIVSRRKSGRAEERAKPEGEMMSTKRRVWVTATLHTKRDEAECVTGFLETAGLSVALADMLQTLQYANAEISRLQADLPKFP
jgi:hypothetical protein